MADTTNNKDTQSQIQDKKYICQEAKACQVEKESLSTKLSNVPVVNSSLQSVSKTCHTIKESNTYVGYGIAVAESSLDKALIAGKAVLDSRVLAPITNTAMDNIRYLDKEAGVMVEKLVKSTNKRQSEGHANGAVQEIVQNATDLVNQSESMFYFLGRKLFEVASFLIAFPYFVPKYALATILGLFKGSADESGRKRKERGSMCEEVKYMEPSPVKRKYADRLSTSSEEGTLVEILRDYVSEDDPEYVPEDHQFDEANEESEDELTEEDQDENIKECIYLTQELEKSESLPEKWSTEEQHSPQNRMNLEANTESKSGVIKLTDAKSNNGNAEQNLEEISLKEASDESNEKTKATKSKIDSTSKTRKGLKSPLLEKLLSPGRRSRRGQKEKTKTAEGDSLENAVAEEVVGLSSSKAGDSKNTEEVSKITEKSSKAEDVFKTTSKVEGKAENTAKSKAKSEKETVESSKGETNERKQEPLSMVTSAFDVLKFGGKKSK